MLKNGTSVTASTTVVLTNRVILARPKPFTSLRNWSTFPEENIAELAVIVIVPSVALGVIVPDGLLKLGVMASLGIAKLNPSPATLQVVLLAPR